MNVVTCNTKTKTPPTSRESHVISETVSEPGYSPWARRQSTFVEEGSTRRPSTFIEEGSIVIPHGEMLVTDGQSEKDLALLPKHAWTKSSDGEIKLSSG